MNKIFKIDCALYPLGLLTAVTGFAMHIAGHADDFHTWVVWAYLHSIIAISFTVMVINHLRTHAAWCKKLTQGALCRKQKITLILGVIAAATVATGLALFAISGANSHMGLLHYKLGIALTIFMAGHSIKRFHIIKQAILQRPKARNNAQ